MRRGLAVAPVVLIAVSGCLATKGDIRLMQDEFRATRAQLGMVDTSVARANEQRRQQIATLSATVDRLTLSVQRTNDSLRVLAQRVATFQGNASGELDALGRQMSQVQAVLSQNVRNLQVTRAQLEQMQNQGPPASAPSSPTPAPSSGANAPPPGTPGAATLFTSGREALSTGAYSTARMSFEQLLTSWPDAEEAPRAMLYIGESYASEGNKPAADSVYQLVTSRYPKSDNAATALYRRAQMAVDARRNADARTLLDRVVKEYPNSDAAVLAQSLLKTIR